MSAEEPTDRPDDQAELEALGEKLARQGLFEEGITQRGYISLKRKRARKVDVDG
jgi:hypothetical protein